MSQAKVLMRERVTKTGCVCVCKLKNLISLAAPLFGPKVSPYLHLQAAYFSIWAYLGDCPCALYVSCQQMEVTKFF